MFEDVAGLVHSNNCVCVLGGATSLVLDAELVAIDRADGNRLKAFQELSTRARGEIAAHQVLLHTRHGSILQRSVRVDDSNWL